MSSAKKFMNFVGPIVEPSYGFQDSISIKRPDR